MLLIVQEVLSTFIYGVSSYSPKTEQDFLGHIVVIYSKRIRLTNRLNSIWWFNVLDSSNFVDPHTINADPLRCFILYKKRWVSQFLTRIRILGPAGNQPGKARSPGPPYSPLFQPVQLGTFGLLLKITIGIPYLKFLTLQNL